jgi:eukaryotic-like serine/threonine-protein kinase
VPVGPGTRLGPYEILLCIARGGMASVWAARQHGARGFSRLVALKTVLPELAAPDLDVMFLDEARVTARIHHPNVCEVFELIEHQGVLALSMEWVDGDTLNNVINNRPKNPALDTRIAAQICADVARGLHAAHELKDERGAPLELVHRDISPQNILLSRTGHVKVTDFGVAKSLGGVREATAVGKVKGKLSYMSPEQAQGKLVDRRSDIFSLGIVLYLATVGSHPFRRAGESRHQQLSRLVMNRVKPPSELVKGYPPELEAIVMRALERDPAARFQTAEDMAHELQFWVLSSGPLINEQHIARTVLERAGGAILERSERIANMMCKPGEARPSLEPTPPAPNDPTLVPTTSRAGVLIPGRGRSARATLGVVSLTLTAAAIAIAACFVFSPPRGTPPFAFAAPSPEEPAASPAAPPMASLPTASPLPASPRVPGSAPVAQGPRAPGGTAPVDTNTDPVPTPSAPALAPPAPSTRAASHAPAQPGARATAAKRASKATKARKPRTTPRRKPSSRDAELSAIRGDR